MGGGWPVACLVLAALVADLRGEDERWSRPATPERRQGDWVPLTCANCRPVLDQNVQSSDNLPSVLTPPPRAEEARLLAPPPPPDGILQTAASGFLPAFTQQQPPRHHKQFLQETTAQSINRPHAQFLRANNPIVSNKPPQPFLREPSQEFQPPQEPRPNRQPQLLQFNHQQFVSDQPYLNQPLLLGPQFLSSPFFPQTSIPPQNIQQINPLQFQPQNPIAPNVSPLNSQAFQLPPDRPSFTQQITAGAPELQALPQPIAQTEAPQQFSVNDTDSQRDEGEKEEVQLLYVPVETLNQRAREKAKSLPTNQQGGLNQAVGTGGNRFAEQSFESSTSNSLIDFQGGFNIQTETSKPQYNTKQNNQFQQQLPPVDQEKFNTQTHTVRQQFVKQNDELQQPAFGTSENIKLDSQNNKQYNFKAINQFQTQSQFQPQVTNFNPQFQQSAQFSNQDGFQSFGNVPVQGQNTRQQFDIVSQPQQDNVNFNGQPFNNNNQQFRTPEFGNVFQQQQFPPLGQQNINTQPLANTQQFNANQNLQLQQQFQQPFSTFRDQDFLNRGTPTQQPQQVQAQNQLQQQHFALPEEQRQTIAPVAQTPLPDTTNTQKTEEQQFKTPQQDLRNLQQVRSNQFTRKFPQDYQQFPTSSSPSQATEASVQEKENNFNHQRTVSQQQPQISSSTPLYNSPQQLSTLTPTSSTLRQPHTTLAPNQPPLSVYMETTEESKVNDVLRLLKNAKTIQVLDTVGPESPQVFVGPSNLKAPAGYFKFELPYLNTLDSNRVERKVDQLPFFVAPLNFNPPPGYSKIPFPSPHIGSVVVSNVTVLRTALHEKQYENAPVPSSTTEQYLNQYTLPGSISPISPQLPSLVNSLRDDIYFGSSTATFPSTTTESTTVAYTTPTYRGRGSNRGAQRGSSNYTPSASNTATRRPQPRTRRPYSRRQPVTTTTTTEEPTTEITTQQSLTPVPEQIAFNSETYQVQNTETPSHLQAREPSQSENQNLNFESNNGNSYYNEQFVANTFNQDFAPQQQHSNLNQNIQQFAVTGRPTNNEQFHHSVVPSQNEHNVEEFQQTTASPSIATGNFQQDDYSLKNQRNNLRRDPARQHQRFRSRQRLTTTTEIYEQPPPATDNQFYSQAGDRQHYKNLQTNNQGIHNQKLVENTHFEANVPQNQYNIQTERSDFDFQTTERLISRPSEEQNVQQNVNDNHSNSQFNPNSQYDQTQFRQNLGSDQQILTNYHDQFHREIFSNQNLEHNQQVPISQTNSQTQYSHQINQKDQFQSTSPPNVDTQENLNQYVNAGHSRGQIEQNYFNQQSHQEIQQQNDHQGLHQQQFQGSPVHVDNTNQRHQTSTLGQLEQVSEIITTTPQEAFTQTTEPSTPQSQQDEYQQQQYNQQRLKYNRPSSRTPITGDSEEHKRGHQHFHNNADTTDTTTTDDITTRASLVRVRGRVRSKQRGSVRQSTTTEEPNYPSSYLHRQKINNENEENKDYNFKKRPSFNSRQTYSSLKNSNKVAISDQNGDENKPNIESQSNAEGSVDYNEGSTTTTETSAQTPTRRYQHILNRNKVRRVRPTGAPSESSGTTRFLRPTTQPPITRLPSSTRGRIRKPVSNKSVISTTEYSKVKPGLDERENFAPSAGSNEIIEPLYQTREKAQPSFGFQRDSHPKTSPKPSFSSDDGEFWNQGVTIQQSTSFDYRPEAVTPPSFKESEEIQGTMSPIWNGQVELQDGNYYDAFNQRHVSRNDQTPFSSDQQKIVYKDIKGRQPVGKENQYPEKNYEEKQQTDPNEEDITPKIYPVYREVANPPEAVEDETTPEVRGDYETQNNNFDEKPNGDAFVRYNKKVLHEDSLNSEVEDGEVKEGALKRKIIATHPGKKGGRRRGSWVRVRVRKPQDMFEAAESQNLGRFSENAIQEVTKTTSEKVWSPEPVTEALLTTTTKEVRNPAQTITFEQALKDMLKEFITNPGDTQEPGNEQEETETEASTDWPDVAQPTNTTEGAKEVIPSKVQLQETVVKMLQDSEDAKSKTPEEETIVQEDKDVGKTTAPEPELTTEVFTQEPTTFVQVVEDAETTVEPEVSTSTEAPKYPQSRVLGTSTTTEISLETEICYRGRCVKTKKVDAESDLLPME